MNIYYEKVATKVKVIGFFAKLFIFLGIVAGVVFALQHFEVLNYYTSYQTYIKYSAIALFVFGVLLLIISMIVNKRKNIRFDGQVIKLCVNNHVEHEFDLKKVDEIFNYRSLPMITYGLQDSLAFRFHKNDIWETISSDLKNSRTKQSSIHLINDITEAYARIKSQRAIVEMNSSQGIRFRYLSLGHDKEYTQDDYNEKLREFEATFKNYNNTYGGFSMDRLVITNDSLYLNKNRVANINEGDYAVARSLHNYNEQYHTSDIIDIFNKNDDLILSVDLTLVINSELFKSLSLSVFTKV